MKAFKDKTEKDLQKTLSEKREELRKKRFSLSGSNQRDAAEARGIRRDIARILTELNARQNAQQ